LRLAFAITVFLALGGVVFNAFSIESMIAFGYISVSASPLLLATLDLRDPREGTAWRARPMFVLRAIFLPLAILNVVIVVVRSGFTFAQLLTPDGLLAMAAQSTFERYAYGTAESNPLLIAAGVINAFLWPSIRAPLAAAMIPGLLPIALHSVVSTEKWPFFCGFIFFFVAATYSAMQRESQARYWMGGLGVAVAALLIAMLSLLLRAGASDIGAAFDLIPDVALVMGHYLFAQYETFGQWLGGHWTTCCALGKYSFIGVADFIGVAEREQGVWTDIANVRGIETNIYTAWRYLIMDFSVVGPVLLIAAYSALVRLTVAWGRDSVSIGLVTLCLVTAGLQNNVTPFVHNSVGLACIFCSVVAATCIRHKHEQA
jgi:hypothetical protein